MWIFASKKDVYGGYRVPFVSWAGCKASSLALDVSRGGFHNFVHFSLGDLVEDRATSRVAICHCLRGCGVRRDWRELSG